HGGLNGFGYRFGADAVGTCCRIISSSARERPIILESMEPPSSAPKAEDGAFVFNEVQLVLAEKRTALSSLRAGIAVFVLPLSVLSVLIATSRYYDILHVMPLMIPLLVVNTALILLGCYLIAHSMRRIHRYDRLIRDIKRKHSAIADLID